MPQKELSERPAKVVLAAKMFYLVIGIGVIRTAMTVVRHADVRSPYFLIFMKLSIYVVSSFLIYKLAKGRNWARWSLVVILGIAIPMTILPTFDAITHSPVQSLLGLLALALYIIALVLLFQRSSSEWFGAGKVPKEQ